MDTECVYIATIATDCHRADVQAGNDLCCGRADSDIGGYKLSEPVIKQTHRYNSEEVSDDDVIKM